MKSNTFDGSLRKPHAVVMQKKLAFCSVNTVIFFIYNNDCRLLFAAENISSL